MVSFSLLGYSSWIISNGNNESIIAGDMLNKDMISINVKYVAYTNLVITEDENNKIVAYDDQGSINDNYKVENKIAYDKLKNLMIKQGLSFDISKKGKHVFENKIGTFKYCINITTAIKYTMAPVCGGSEKYEGAYTIYKYPITKSADAEYFNTDIVDTINIKNNSQLPQEYLNEIINSNNNYMFLGFMNSLADGTPGTTILPIDNKFSESSDIYACFNKVNDGTIPSGNITNQIINANSTINIYLGNDDNNFNIKNDITYFSQLRTIFIGKSENLEIKNGTTVNFCLNNGKTIYESYFNADKQLTSDPFNSKHSLQYKILLTSDVIINGNMLIGGSYGSGSNTDTQGNINSEFVCLDLNGHNLIINGKLESYGVITDSVGTGSIEVSSSGYLKSLAVIYDYKGGTSTQNQANKKICPFQVYNIPYLMCNLKFNNTNNSWGKFDCIIRIHTTSKTSASNVELNILGPSNCLFTPQSSNGQIVIKYSKIEELSKDATLKKYTLDGRMQFNFYNCDIKLSNLKINAGATINTQELSFPISSFFDINLYNSSFTFEQSISFMPGSSLYVDEDSSIILSYNSSRSATISVIDQPVYSYNFTAGNSLNMSSSINASNVSVAKLFWENTNLWKYYNKSQILCNGTLYFKSGNSNPYKIAGQFNFNKIGYIGTNGVKNTINSNFPFETLKSVGCNFITYDYDYMPGIYSDSEKTNYKGYARPLVSYNEAYVYDGSNEMIGTFDFNSGIFECNNKSYILNAGTTMNDKTITIEECTINLDHTVTTSSGTFAYYCNIFMPVTISSDKNTCTISKMTNSSSSTHNISYNNTLNCWVKAHD